MSSRQETAQRWWRRNDLWICVGLFAVGVAVYVLSGPGRIDMTDGQWRYEVSLGLVETGRPVVRDPLLARSGIPGPDGHLYSAYGAGGSMAGAPLVWLGSLGEDPDGELRRFLFSHTSALFAAALLVVLYLFYRALGVRATGAVGWTLVTGFASLLWPLATSTFDQAQHALIVLAALFLAFLSARRGSMALAAAGGVVGGLLLSYQEVYVILLPALALACRTEPDDADDTGGRRRFLMFLVAAGTGAVLYFLYNYWRFDGLLFSGKLTPPRGHPSIGGYPPAGLWGLLLSPGKSIVLYSPPVLLSLLGLAGLRRRRVRLAEAVVALCVVHLALISSLSFWSGEWSWGPRYLVLLLAPLALALPFLPLARWRRPLVIGLVALGLVVQLLALSLDHQRFFFERRLPPYFWGRNSAFYLLNSQLAARPLELASTLRKGVPEEARQFQPTPYPESITYCIFGSRESFTDPGWVDRFQVFHLPRPWPLWMPRIDPSRYRLPVSPVPLTLTLALLGLLGSLAIGRGLAGASRDPGT